MRAARGLLTLLLAFGLAGSAHAAPATLFDVAKLPLPAIDGKEIADSQASYSSSFAPRSPGTPGEAAATEFLVAEARSFGYETTVQPMPIRDGDGTGLAKAIVATKKGLTKPDEYLVFMAHYDSNPGVGGVSVEAAYDNASGTMMLRAMAKALAAVPTNRSVMVVWYNGEEEGLLASEAHAKAQKAAGMKVRMAFGFDMVGIAYPVGNPVAGSCLCIWHGADDEGTEALQRRVNFGVLGFPEGDRLVELRGKNARSSDESAWDDQGYPTMRWAGMQAAADYPAVIEGRVGAVGL